MRASFMGSGRTYGARRVWHDLLAEGVSCGLHRKLPAFPPQPESDHPVRSCSTD
jgi:transposase InsO family protein